MAARVEAGGNMSKSERKIQKKLNRARHNLLKRDGIVTSSVPTRNLVIVNGGLDNGVKRQDLELHLKDYGCVIDIVMIPKKPYAFVQYRNKDEATRACQALHGRPLSVKSAHSAVILYFCFIDKIQESTSQKKSFPQGLILIPDFVSKDEEQELLDCVDWKQDEICGDEHVKQSLKHRRVKHYGYEFMYGVNNVDPEKPLEQGIPAECDQLLHRILALGHISQLPDQLTVNQYDPGQGIPSHIDTHSAFEDGIISLSLGSQVVMEFKHPDGTHIPVVLPQRSLLIMTGESRYLWSHGITPRKSDIVPHCKTDSQQEQAATAHGEDEERLTLSPRATRTSFTFRVVARQPCCCNYPEQCDSQQCTIREEYKQVESALPTSHTQAVELEEQHVHKVYNEIAGHFSSTRHSPWPRVVDFLNGLPDGALVADVGCGNGKYLGVRDSLFMIGCDRSIGLCQICAARNHAVFVSDALAVPLKSAMFDACISIAVIHHMSTEERRRMAIEELVRLLRSGGQALIYVWAMEQERHKVKSKYLKQCKFSVKQEANCQSTTKNVASGGSQISECSSSDNNGTAIRGVENYSQVLDSQSDVSPETEELQTTETDDCVGTFKSESLKDRSGAVTSTCESTSVNKPAKTLRVHVNRTKFQTQDLLVPWHLRNGKKQQQQVVREESATTDAGTDSVNLDKKNENVYHRYYHVFQEGELEALCRQVVSVDITSSYYDQGNWCVIVTKR